MGVYIFMHIPCVCFYMYVCVDDYGTLLLAESLLEECLLENVSLLRCSTPLTDHSHPKLARAKAHLNNVLSRGRMEVCE